MPCSPCRGALYGSGAYGWTTEAEPAIAEFERRLATIGTDYADFGFIHCIDEDADLDRVMNGGIWDYAQARHADGTIRHLAFSTHNPHIARRPPPRRPRWRAACLPCPCALRKSNIERLRFLYRRERIGKQYLSNG